jgi:signal transduction histidine kinase
MVVATFTGDQLAALFPGVQGSVVQVYDHAGRIVAGSTAAGLTYQQRAADDSPGVRAALDGRTLTLEGGNDDALAHAGDGKQIAAFAPVSRFGWAVSASRDYSDVEGPLKGLFRRQLVSQAWAMFGALLLVFLFSRAISRPLARLATKVQAVGHGERPDLAGERGPVEVQTLAAALDTMAGEIESRIARREADLAARDHFVSIAAHELRTPLTSLKATIQLAQRQISRDAPRAEVEAGLSLADAQVDRLTRLVQELLESSRIAAGRLTIERRPVALTSLLRRVVELERAVDPDRVIQVSVPDPSPVIHADAGRLEQVLFNLLENGRKYSPADTALQVTVWTAGDEVAIAVRDQGPGIPPEEQSRIFERFYRAPGSAAGATGLGLGLYIVHEIVRAHGGRLTLESAPQQGSTFTVFLPRDAQDDEM